MSLAATRYAVLLTATCFCASPALAGEPRGPIVIVGVDGMTFDVLDPLMASGGAPNFAQLIADGSRAILRSERPMRSPALWTTIATGQPRDVHQIFDFVTGSVYWPRDQRSADQRLVTSDMRHSPALWNLATAAGQKSLVVGWLNTWPAESITGTMVAPYVALGASRQTSIKGRIYNDVAQQSHPAELFEELQPLLVDTDAVTRAQVSRLIDEPPSSSPLFSEISQLRRYMYTVRWSLAGGETNVRILEHQLERDRFDLVMTYFDGSDTLAHRFWLLRQSLDDIRARLAAHGYEPGRAEELKARFGGVLEGYYRTADAWLGRLRAAAGPGATFVVVSDHGWGPLAERGPAPYDSVPFDGEHRLDGIFIASGPAVRHTRAAPLELYDIAPTALALLGHEKPGALRGRVAEEILDTSRLPDRRIVLADRKATRDSAQPARITEADGETPFEDIELERLRSLGYVQ